MNKRIRIGIALVIILLVSFWLLPSEMLAQCPMCRMTAESNLKSGGSAGRGLNAGILYMLALPYLLVGAIGFWWWRNRKRSTEVENDLPELLEEDSSRYN